MTLIEKHFKKPTEKQLYSFIALILSNKEIIKQK